MASKVDKIKLTRDQGRRARFTEDQVREMRDLYASGYTQKAIAEMYETCQSTVGYIVSTRARQRLTEYKKLNPSKGRSKEDNRVYMRELRRYKKSLMQGVNHG